MPLPALTPQQEAALDPQPLDNRARIVLLRGDDCWRVEEGEVSVYAARMQGDTPLYNRAKICTFAPGELLFPGPQLPPDALPVDADAREAEQAQQLSLGFFLTVGEGDKLSVVDRRALLEEPELAGYAAAGVDNWVRKITDALPKNADPPPYLAQRLGGDDGGDGDGDGEQRVVFEQDGCVQSGVDPEVLWLRFSRADATAAAATDAADAADAPATVVANPGALATVVYTSGTTGKPKGVQLSHANILSNARAGLRSVAVFPADKFLSFLPLSHMFERTVGYYLPVMAGATVAFNRAIADLPADLAHHKPTIIIAVPRIFERAYNAIDDKLARGPAIARWLFECAVEVGWRRFERAQGRAAWHPKALLWPVLDALVARKIRRRFGGKLRCVISGGAPLAAHVSRVFIALGIDILQGYGLTETAPTLSVNTAARNKPASIGLPFIGVEIRLAPDGELQARGPNIMRGYWRNEEATRACIDAQGWFSSGDLARIDADGFLFITGRSKDIIVTATGEKAPPADMEAAICQDALFDQAMVVGEGRAFLAAIVVLNPQRWREEAARHRLVLFVEDDAALLEPEVEEFLRARIAGRLRDFPGYAAVRRVCATLEPWSTADGSLTPTLKIKRAVLRERFAADLERFYGD